MPLLTTTIGSYPKPTYISTPDWFRQEATNLFNPTEAYETLSDTASPYYTERLDRGVQQVVLDQVNAGIDIPTDGEVRRENYIHYHCRHLDGIDFDYLTEKVMRDGSWTAEVPTVVGEIQPRERFLIRDWQVAQAVTEKPVKVTIPGPMTITDTTANDFYPEERQLGVALAEALNVEIKALAEEGCTWIQIDEPLFAREPAKAISYGIENLERAFHGVPKRVKRATHICCGYPDVVDNEDYPKADNNIYAELADALEQIDIHAISIEDAHRPNNLELLELYKTKTIILGVIAIARTRVEEVDDIIDRLRAALDHIDSHRLIAAPDCGLGMLDRQSCLAKLTNISVAAKAI